MPSYKIDNILQKIIKYASLALLLVPLLVNKNSYFPYITPKVLAIFWLTEIAIVSYVILAFRNKDFRPKFNALSVTLLILAGIYIITSITGLSFNRSFWGDWERAEGTYIILHFVAWFLALSFTLKKYTDWQSLIKTSVYVSLAMGLLGFVQYLIPAGNIFLNFLVPPSGERIFSTIGNAAMLASYSIIHIFLSLYLWSGSTSKKRWLYFGIGLVNLLVVLLTATRGAFFGLVAALIVYLGLAFKNKLYQKKDFKFLFVIAAAFFILGFGLFFSRDLSFVKNNNLLSRFTQLDFQAGTIKTRLLAWQYSWEGFKKQPLLGVGPENYNLVFDKEFQPEMYKYAGNEIWFSRAHNKLIDQAIMNGVFGLIAYLMIFVWLFVYLGQWLKKKQTYLNEYVYFILLLVAYFVQNLFLFDNLSSYILFFFILAFVSYLKNNYLLEDLDQKENKTVPAGEGGYVSLGIGLVVLILFSWFNFNYLKANNYVYQGIVGFDQGDYLKFTENFEKGIESSINPIQPVSLYASKMADLLTRLANQNLPKDELVKHYQKLENYFTQINQLDPVNMLNAFEEAKNYIFMAEIVDNKDLYNKAFELINKSKVLSPSNIRPYWEEFQIYETLGQYDKAEGSIKKALEMAPEVPDTNWMIALFYFDIKDETKAYEYADKTIDLGYNFRLYADAHRLIEHYEKNKDWPRVIYLINNLISLKPHEPDLYLALADVYLLQGQKDQAINTLKRILTFNKSMTDEVVTRILEITKQ
jgi:O-antigen ligase